MSSSTWEGHLISRRDLTIGREEILEDEKEGDLQSERVS